MIVENKCVFGYLQWRIQNCTVGRMRFIYLFPSPSLFPSLPFSTFLPFSPSPISSPLYSLSPSFPSISLPLSSFPFLHPPFLPFPSLPFLIIPSSLP